MNGRRMVAAGVVVAAVTVGGVAGALIGVPGLSGASSSPDVVDRGDFEQYAGGRRSRPRVPRRPGSAPATA